MNIETEKELMEKLSALGEMDNETRNNVVCSLIGHSKIQTAFFGYYNCSRCGDQIGDSIGGIYNSSNLVIVGHDCPTCRANYDRLDWRDKVFAPDPFAKKELCGDCGAEIDPNATNSYYVESEKAYFCRHCRDNFSTCIVCGYLFRIETQGCLAGNDFYCDGCMAHILWFQIHLRSMRRVCRVYMAEFRFCLHRDRILPAQ
jgi:hypothetical protein